MVWSEQVNDPSTPINREHQRRRVIKGGVIAFSNRRITVPCMVRDISDAGARLKVDRASEIPDTFDLLVDLDGCEYECEVMWREDNQIGVRFLAEPTHKNPTRLQVVQPSFPAPGSALRESVRLKRQRPQETGAPGFGRRQRELEPDLPVPGDGPGDDAA